MKLNLFDLLQASALDPDSPDILLNVRLSEQDKSITKKEVAERLGVCETTVYNMTKDGRLHPFKVNGSTRYSLREVNSIINPSNDD